MDSILHIIFVIIIFKLVVITAQVAAIKFRLNTFDLNINDGIAQMFYNGTWGAVDTSFRGDTVDFTSKALCNSIGFGYEGFSTYNGYHKNRDSSVLTWVTGFACTSNQTYATECIDENSLRLRNTTVFTVLHCYTFNVTGIRLTWGIVPSQGLLEVKISERWGAVRRISRYNIKDEFGDFICQNLGYIEESVIQPVSHGPAYAIITVGSCTNISSIYDLQRQCNIQKGWSGSENEICDEINCEPVRLVDGPSNLEGRVEAGLFGMLRTICGLGFDQNAANVTCTSLGYSGLARLHLKTIYGIGNVAMYLRNITCTGNEPTLEQCIHSNADIQGCGENDVVSVACVGDTMKLSEIKSDESYFSTYHSAGPHEGYFMARHGGQWYDILGSVSVTTTQTLCSMLGFGAVGFSLLSPFEKHIIYYKHNISCHGNESHINDCSGDLCFCGITYKPYCFDISKIFGRLVLFCSDYEIQRIALDNGVVELTINNKTWSVCEDFFNNETADSVCRILGYTGSRSFQATSIQQGENPIIGRLECEHGASTLQECKMKHQFSYRSLYARCGSKIDVICKNECRQGYFGPSCSKCPCKSVNTHSCNVVTGECTCRQGWSGKTCTDDENECLSANDICKDPLICVNTGGSYFCQCPVGMFMIDTSDGGRCKECTNSTYGINCLTPCSCNTTNTYQSDQICEIKTGQCHCKPEWTGTKCETDVNECAISSNLACQENNTECINKDGGYTCNCIGGYKQHNRTCVPSVQKAADKYNPTIIAIASAACGGTIVIIVSIVVVVCFVRSRETPKGQVEHCHNNQHASSDNTYIGDRTNAVSMAERLSPYSPYENIQQEHENSHEYTSLSRNLHNTFDIPYEAEFQQINLEDMSDGYLKPNLGRTDINYVADEYLEPMKHLNSENGNYLHLERTDGRSSNDYLQIKR